MEISEYMYLLNLVYRVLFDEVFDTAENELRPMESNKKDFETVLTYAHGL